MHKIKNKKIILLTWILVLSIFCMSFQTDTTSYDPSGEDSGVGILLALGISIVFTFLVRGWMLKYVRKMMRLKSSGVSSDLPSELNEPEKKADTRPVFLDLDRNILPEHAIALREKFVGNAFNLFLKKYFYEVVACLLYFLVSYSLSGFGKVATTNVEMITGLAFIYFVYLSLQFLFNRKQFRPENTHFGIRIVHPYIAILKLMLQPRWGSYVLGGFIFIMVSSGITMFFPGEQDPKQEALQQNIWMGIGIIAAVAFHLFLIWRLRKAGKQSPNWTLLILRVFGDNKKALLTFGRLIRFWEHFGSWFTVVDPSYLSRQYRIFTLRTLKNFVVILFVALIIGVILQNQFSSYFNIAEENSLSTFFLAGMLITWLVYIASWRYSIRRSYPKDLESIRKKLGKVINNPRNLDLTYKNLPMFCFDNTWKLAVREFVKESKVILMDLRGYSEKRKGCEYEVDFLFDTYPINNILFLVDNANDRQLVYKLILERWEYLRIHSPNLKVKEPIAKICISQTEDERDVQNLLDLLIETSQEEVV